ncbi:MAG TPA: hypothetical protein VF897_23675 [Roseiflexaceae bacterium]
MKPTEPPAAQWASAVTKAPVVSGSHTADLVDEREKDEEVRRLRDGDAGPLEPLALFLDRDIALVNLESSDLRPRYDLFSLL